MFRIEINTPPLKNVRIRRIFGKSRQFFKMTIQQPGLYHHGEICEIIQEIIKAPLSPPQKDDEYQESKFKRNVLFNFYKSAIEKDNIAIIEWLFSVNSCVRDYNLLQFAVEKGNLSIIKFLIQSFKFDHLDETLCEIAAKMGHIADGEFPKSSLIISKVYEMQSSSSSHVDDVK